MSSANAPNIRSLADGEIPPPLDSGDSRPASSAPADPHLGSQLAFQTEFRRRVANAFTSATPSVPVELVDRVRTAIAAEPVTGEPAFTPESLESPVTVAASARMPRISIFAVAASLALVAGAVLFGIFGPRIDRVAPTFTNQPADLNTQAALFANQEHDRFAQAKELPVDLLCWKSADEAQSQIAQWLSRPGFTIADLSALGYDFQGACQSEFPGAQRAARMLYARTSSSSSQHHHRAYFSVFIVPDNGQFDQNALNRMVPGKTYSLKPRSRCRLSVQRCTDSQLMYFMVCCDQRDLPALATRVATCVVSPSTPESTNAPPSNP